MNYRNQIAIRDAVHKRAQHFKGYNYKNDRAKVRRGSKAVEEIVNLLDYYVDINDISVTVFDEIVCLIADEALSMSFSQFKNHIWLVSEMCNLSVYNSKITTKDLFNRIDWNCISEAYEKEVAYGL